MKKSVLAFASVSKAIKRSGIVLDCFAYALKGEWQCCANTREKIGLKNNAGNKPAPILRHFFRLHLFDNDAIFFKSYGHDVAFADR